MRKKDTIIIENGIADQIVFSGVIFVRKLFSKWKPRYCELVGSRKLNFYDSQDQHELLSSIDLITVVSIRQTQNPNLSPTGKGSKDKQQKFVFEITTITEKFVLACDDENVMEQWTTHLNSFTFGDIAHSGYMTKLGHNVKSWKKRFFTLSSHWKELRYYLSDKRINYKGKIDLSSVNVLRIGTNLKKDMTKGNHLMELITPNRTYKFINEFYGAQTNWIDKLTLVLKGKPVCCYCHLHDNIQLLCAKRCVYYKINALHHGKLNIFDDGKWIQKYGVIDGRSMRLFYTKTMEEMDIFLNSIIMNKYFELYVEQHLEGYYLLCGENIEIIGGNNKNNNNNNIDDDDDDDIYDDPAWNIDKTLGECLADDEKGPGFFTPGQTASGNDDYKDNGSDDDDNKDIDPFFKEYDRFPYKFTIGDQIFGVKELKQAKFWVNAMKNAIDLTLRDVYHYDDETRYVCVPHLGLLIHGFLFELRDDIKDAWIPFGANRYIKKCIGRKNDNNLVTF